MKKIIIFAMAALLTLAPITLSAQTAPPPAAATAASVAKLMIAIRAASGTDRQKMVEDAIKADPSISSALVAALITSFPSEAANYTATVVNTVVNLTITQEAKAAILTAVATSAVPAALQLPPSSVTNLVAAVNAVKAALANVPPEFTVAVQNFIAPISGVVIAEDGTITEIVSASSL